MKFDLVTEAWIPVTEKETGITHEVGIRDALLRAHEWGELQCASPLETAALLRMLLAVLHRACQPQNRKEWQALWRTEQFSIDAIVSYLEKYADRFDLFGDERPFMQVGKMRMAQAGSMAQLATETATGNNPTLFSHATDVAPDALTPAQAARRLLGAQSFALGFGKAAEAFIEEKTWARPYLADAICLRGVTLFLSGDTLFQTLLLNLVLDKSKKEGVPYWELDEPTSVLDGLIEVKEDGKVKLKRDSVRAKSFVERYAWPSRMTRLLLDDDGLVRRAYFTQGREADKDEGDPMKVFVSNAQIGIYALNLNAEKSAWRDLHSYLGAASTGAHKPTVVHHAATMASPDLVPPINIHRINVVGLATDPGKAGKFLLWRHDRMSVPAALLENEDLIGYVATAVSDSEVVAGELRKRMYVVAQRFLPPEGNPDPKDVDNLLSALDPRRAYWARLEAHFARFLFRLAEAPEDALEEWRKSAAGEAKRALQASCNQLGESARALRATALVDYRFNANQAEVAAEIAAAIAAAKTKKKKAPAPS